MKTDDVKTNSGIFLAAGGVNMDQIMPHPPFTAGITLIEASLTLIL